MNTIRALLLVVVCVLPVAVSSCSAPATLRYVQAEKSGKVYYLDGVGNYGFGKQSVPEGFHKAGFRGDVEYWRWSASGTLLDQLSSAALRSKGRELARMITLYQRTYPDQPVSLVGLSAGTAVAVFACEQLPEGVCVDEVVLIASSMSRQYNLSKALRHVRGDITLYQTGADVALGLGARITGPVAGPPATCAGLTGFAVPPKLTDEQKELYKRVINVPYNSAFAKLGFHGGHTSAVESPEFVRQKIASLVVKDEAETSANAPLASAAGGGSDFPRASDTGGEAVASGGQPAKPARPDEVLTAADTDGELVWWP